MSDFSMDINIESGKNIEGNINNDGDRGGSIKIFNIKKNVKSKNLHVSLKGDDVERLNWLKDRVAPHTQTAVIENSLQLFEEMLKEFCEGSIFYIKRPGGEVNEYKIFDE